MGTVETDFQTSFRSQAAVLPQTAAARPWRNHFEGILTGAEVLSDVLTVVLGLLCSERIYLGMRLGTHAHYSPRVVWASAIGFAVLFVLLLDRDGAYRRSHSLLRIRETERVLRVSLQSFVLTLPLAYFSGYLVARWVFALAFVLIPTLLVVQKNLTYVVVRALHAQGHGVRRVI